MFALVLIRLNVNFSGKFSIPKSASIRTEETKKDSGNFVKPLAANIPVTSPFGYRIHPILRYRKLHTGIDYGASMGTPVMASKKGCVIFANNKGGYGATIEIKHDAQYSTLYAHNSKLLVEVGRCVNQGDVVALSGNTGMSTSTHVHFEIRENNKPIDPSELLNKN